MKLALLTPTGDRPEAFSLCQRWMQRQTRQPDLWFVMDDGVNETSVAPADYQIATLRLPPWDKPGTSQHRNMLALLDAAEESDCDAFVIVEDDDWYGKHYLERCASLLQVHELIGERPARYYNVRTRHWRTFQNHSHASLCQTAFRRSMIQPLREVVSTGAWIDMTFWPRYFSRGHLWEGCNVLGIKGMPGRAGVSNAHRETAAWGQYDPSLEKLREWIGNDAEAYAGFVEEGSMQSANWCASCGMATVKNAGDICERCNSAGADRLRVESFVYRGITMYRCAEYPECRFDTASMDTLAKHLSGCVVREEKRRLAGPSIPLAGGAL
jgi:hypothetical protein